MYVFQHRIGKSWISNPYICVKQIALFPHFQNNMSQKSCFLLLFHLWIREKKKYLKNLCLMGPSFYNSQFILFVWGVGLTNSVGDQSLDFGQPISYSSLIAKGPQTTNKVSFHNLDYHQSLMGRNGLSAAVTCAWNVIQGP